MSREVLSALFGNLEKGNLIASETMARQAEWVVYLRETLGGGQNSDWTLMKSHGKGKGTLTESSRIHPTLTVSWTEWPGAGSWRWRC